MLGEREGEWQTQALEELDEKLSEQKSNHFMLLEELEMVKGLFDRLRQLNDMQIDAAVVEELERTVEQLHSLKGTSEEQVNILNQIHKIVSSKEGGNLDDITKQLLWKEVVSAFLSLLKSWSDKHVERYQKDQ